MMSIMEAGTDARMEVDTKESELDTRVLQVVDPKGGNILPPRHIGSLKVGSWKRKARAKGKENLRAQENGKIPGNNKPYSLDKKKFCLLDEGEDTEDFGHCGKKVRLCNEEMSCPVALVEVTSQKWAQINQ